MEYQLNQISLKIPLKDTFIQELVQSKNKNNTLSFTAFCIDGVIKCYWIGIKLMEHPLEYGTATLAQSIKNDIVLQQSKILLKELNYTGVCEVEYLFDSCDCKYKLIEINPRTWLWVDLAIKNGINYPLFIYDYLNNKNIEFKNNYIDGLKWFNPFTNTIYGLKALVTRKISLSKLREINSGRKINALFDKKDIKPIFAYGFLIFNMIRRR